MKKSILAVAVFALLIAVLSPISVMAAKIDTSAPSSLEIVYKNEDTVFEGLTVKTYRIADTSAEGEFTLSEEFAEYPVALYGVESQTEWQNIAATLAGFAVADNIPATAESVTDSKGTVKFDKLIPGMYLTLGVTHSGDSVLTVFEDFLTAVPIPSDNGTYNYNITAYPKHETKTISKSEITHKIIKQWKDVGFMYDRPDSITVDIYKNGELYSTEVLSSDNNWMYSWNTEDDGAAWIAVERNIPDAYTVNITESGNTIIITNIRGGDFPDAPQTGDTVIIWPYVIVMCIAGLFCSSLGILKMRTSR